MSCLIITTQSFLIIVARNNLKSVCSEEITFISCELEELV